MKILLINPCCQDESGRDLYSAHITGPLFTIQPFARMALGMPLALPTLAACTPAGHEVKIVDEEIEEIPFEEPVDLVGLTAMTFKATRAYEIARRFRARGVPVVMGGIHASMCPEEAQQHVDCVVVGEADLTWPVVVADAAAGNLKKRYLAGELPDLASSAAPRHDLVKNDQYIYCYLQTTRGCPHDCTFCTVTRMSGRKLRRKTPQQVVEEVKQVVGLDHKRSFKVRDRLLGKKVRVAKMVAFIDDNFAIDRRHALEICRELSRYQRENELAIPWYTQANVEVGFDEELLGAMSEANCQFLFMGFESLDPTTLDSMQKGFNSPERYAEAIRNVHRHGIRIIFSTIVGDDNTSQASVDYLERFLQENHLLHVLLNVLTPYPGTRLFREMGEEGRILTKSPEMYNIRNVVFRPKNLERDQLQRMFQKLCENVYGFGQVYRRGTSLLPRANRLYFPLPDRLVVALGLVFSALVLMLRGKLCAAIALQILVKGPYLMLRYGTLYALELLVTSADYDHFARGERQRLEQTPS